MVAEWFKMLLIQIQVGWPKLESRSRQQYWLLKTINIQIAGRRVAWEAAHNIFVKIDTPWSKYWV